MALQKVSMIWSSEPMTLGSRRRASISAGSSSMPNSPLSQACTASLGASFRRDSKRCRSRMSWKYAHCRLQVQGAQAAAASAERFCGGRVHAAVVGKEGVADLTGVDAEQEEVVQLEEIAAGDAQNGLQLVET